MHGLDEVESIRPRGRIKKTGSGFVEKYLKHYKVT